MTSCAATGKRCYENRASVYAAMRSRKVKRDGQVPYHCRKCGRWHLGSKLQEVAPDSNSAGKLSRRRRTERGD